MVKKKKTPVEVKIRFYPEREPDAQCIAWLEQLERSVVFGDKHRAIKDALLRGIGFSAGQGVSAPVSVDADTIRVAIDDAMSATMVQIRRVVEAGVNSALSGFTGRLTPQPAARSDDERDEIEALLVGLDQDALIVVDDE